ncbi:hypothetical protein EYF80_008173 [Liparis tanakae]|uniref:Uncharacterized protein n=1 Tax=Liparis tanakae TaxID=230148 RepID=A0A4Z2IVF0_9TELE|nr:hypothetical protein EYF80_008173 [Liparis tanakae]
MAPVSMARPFSSALCDLHYRRVHHRHSGAGLRGGGVGGGLFVQPLLPGVGLLVVPQVGEGLEGLAALRTDVRPLARRVFARVAPRGGLHKRRVALQEVAVSLPPGQEAVVAVGTRERGRRPGVLSVAVRRQLGGPAEGGGAFGAAQRRGAGVQLAVLPERRGEALGARAARERLFVGGSGGRRRSGFGRDAKGGVVGGDAVRRLGGLGGILHLLGLVCVCLRWGRRLHVVALPSIPRVAHYHRALTTLNRLLPHSFHLVFRERGQHLALRLLSERTPLSRSL